MFDWIFGRRPSAREIAREVVLEQKRQLRIEEQKKQQFEDTVNIFRAVKNSKKRNDLLKEKIEWEKFRVKITISEMNDIVMMPSMDRHIQESRLHTELISIIQELCEAKAEADRRDATKK